jgi:membrane fusion protein, multidrug efflux system
MTNSGDSTELDDRSRVGASHVPTRAGGPQESTDDSAERTSAPHGKPPRWIRPALFLLLPILLIAGGYCYISGSQVTSMGDAYVEADKVGVSSVSNDVSGIVKQANVAENQHVEAARVLFLLDDLPFRPALQRAEAQVGRDSLNALKANFRDMQAQIKQGQNHVQYFATEAHRQQDLSNAHVASQSTYDMANRNLQNAQQKLTSLNQQLAAIAANLDGEPAGFGHAGRAQ